MKGKKVMMKCNKRMPTNNYDKNYLNLLPFSYYKIENVYN
jgi:hypothetical protein